MRAFVGLTQTCSVVFSVLSPRREVPIGRRKSDARNLLLDTWPQMQSRQCTSKSFMTFTTEAPSPPPLQAHSQCFQNILASRQAIPLQSCLTWSATMLRPSVARDHRMSVRVCSYYRRETCYRRCYCSHVAPV